MGEVARLDRSAILTRILGEKMPRGALRYNVEYFSNLPGIDDSNPLEDIDRPRGEQRNDRQGDQRLKHRAELCPT